MRIRGYFSTGFERQRKKEDAGLFVAEYKAHKREQRSTANGYSRCSSSSSSGREPKTHERRSALPASPPDPKDRDSLAMTRPRRAHWTRNARTRRDGDSSVHACVRPGTERNGAERTGPDRTGPWPPAGAERQESGKSTHTQARVRALANTHTYTRPLTVNVNSACRMCYVLSSLSWSEVPVIYRLSAARWSPVNIYDSIVTIVYPFLREKERGRKREGKRKKERARRREKARENKQRARRVSRSTPSRSAPERRRVSILILRLRH